LAQNAGSSECFQYIQDRLHTCCNSHTACLQPSGTLPKRVIEIGPGNDQLALRETTCEVGHYAALSYCWGESKSLLKTTNSTLDLFKRNIPWHRLPRAIQDSIEIGRKLSLRFIWIDCLCIIQDCRSDWEIEASKMGDYYQNAYVTIAASASSSAQCGILIDRPMVSHPHIFKITCNDGEDHSVIAQKRHRIQFPHVISDFGPLSERAWTFQENALSTRIIHFTDSEIIWECRTEIVSEDNWPIRDNCTGLVQQLVCEAKEDPEACWRFLVRAYSARSLTFLSDKLTAISGIAAYLQQQTGYQYAAGLWQETLLMDLLWSSWGWEDLEKPPPTVQGPSWSWASLHGGVAFITETMLEGTLIEKHSIIKDLRIERPGENPFGQVTEGIIEVTGPLSEITIEFDGTVDEWGLPLFKLSQGSISPSLFSPDTSLEEREIESINGDRERTVQRTSAIPVPLQAKIWCLWLCTAREDSSPPKLHGIALAKSFTTPGAYTRVGLTSAEDLVFLHTASCRTVVIV
jgi:hypothetical protein